MLWQPKQSIDNGNCNEIQYHKYYTASHNNTTVVGFPIRNCMQLNVKLGLTSSERVISNNFAFYILYRMEKKNIYENV